MGGYIGRAASVPAAGVRRLGEPPPARGRRVPQEENRVLREQLGDRRLRFTDDQRRRLAANGRTLGRRVLNQLDGLVTSDTILRWYRELIAKKYDGTSQREGGRPGTATLPPGFGNALVCSER
jgi:hypothetical protein